MSPSQHSQGPNAPKTAQPERLRQRATRAGQSSDANQRHSTASGKLRHWGRSLRRVPRLMRIIGTFGMRRQVPATLLTATERIRQEANRRRQIREGNMFLVRWITLSLIVLSLVLLLMLSGFQTRVEEWQTQLLCREPFYIEAQQLQEPLLSTIGNFAVSVIVTLYLSLVLLREPHWARRTQLAFLAAAVLAMPGLLCVLWSGIITPLGPVSSVVALWLLTSLIPFYIRRSA